MDMTTAYKLARQAIETTYRGTAAVYVYGSEQDERGLQRVAESRTMQDVPCKVSFESHNAAKQTETADGLTQTIRLFVAPDCDIPTGSKISVLQDGVTTVYKAAGQPAIYPTHREYELELFEGWA